MSNTAHWNATHQAVSEAYNLIRRAQQIERDIERLGAVTDEAMTAALTFANVEPAEQAKRRAALDRAALTMADSARELRLLAEFSRKSLCSAIDLADEEQARRATSGPTLNV